MPALRNLTPIEPLTDHIALVTCLEYSPHGNYLASGSWDGHAIIWKVEGATYSKHTDIPHKAIIGKVAWSPDGSYLITKTKKVIKVWRAKDGTLVKDLPMKEARAVTWLPHPFTENFAIVERDQVRVMNIKGLEESTHTFERMAIHDVAFTPDAERMILVATLELSPTGLKSSKSRAEKLIIAYNIEHRRIEDQMPILGNVREVAVSRDGKHALVSYETTTPPEVWQIRLEGSTAKLELHHACVPASQVRFEGPSYFGGTRDQFVFSASRNGEIHIWDRESGLLLHTIQAMQGTGEEGGYLSAMAWNRGNPDVFMVAAALHDGDIRVWTAPAPPARA
ncbi:hypothetical protein FRC02_007015 [Tulasnella sp. 418]|nr:hypothetical protein FRC02_007015 [Tulasnella sp. 418]